jgi:hypothetical protein
MTHRNRLMLLPLYCIVVFFCLFAIAAWRYPGGTKFDKSTVGFSMRHNYWCDMLDATAYNGQPNPGSKIAIIATLVLCFGVAWLCYFFPLKTNTVPLLRWGIQVFGIGSMCIFALLFTPLHNLVILVGAPLGGIALLGVTVILQRLGWHGLFYCAMCCFLLAAANYIVYQTKVGLGILPVLQKATFALFAIWIALVNWEMEKAAP